MECKICDRDPCRCGKGGPRSVGWKVGYGSETPWDTLPPKTTTSQPRLGVDPFNNSPRQPNIETK